MQDLDRLQLFPAVFAMPQGQEEQLSTSYGSRGVQLMDAAEQLLGSWQPAVLPCLSCFAWPETPGAYAYPFGLPPFPKPFINS